MLMHAGKWMGKEDGVIVCSEKNVKTLSLHFKILRLSH